MKTELYEKFFHPSLNRLPSNHMKLLRIFLGSFNSEYKCFLTNEQLADSAVLSLSAVYKTKKELERLGYINVHKLRKNRCYYTLGEKLLCI